MERRWKRVIASMFLPVIAAGCAGFCAQASAQTAQRPRITRISHVGFFVSDLPKAEAFWHDLLGYQVAYTLPKKNGAGVRIAFIKINDHQHVELFNEPPVIPHNMMSHVCFSVDNIETMRTFLRAHGYNVKPGDGTTKAGDYAFEIRDPNGLLIEFAQTLPTGKEAMTKGKFTSNARISPRIYHVGYLVGDAQKTEAFYKMLGFTETWRGGANPTELSWINMKVPDGEDYIELMLYRSLGSPKGWGTKNHISLMVPDIEKAVHDLESRPYYKEYRQPLVIHTGVNQKRQLNLYDPDGTRVELMEPNTVTGKPAPSSTAPPPPPSAEPPFHG